MANRRGGYGDPTFASRAPWQPIRISISKLLIGGVVPADAERCIRRLIIVRAREPRAGTSDRYRGKIGLGAIRAARLYVLPLVSIFVWSSWIVGWRLRHRRSRRARRARTMALAVLSHVDVRCAAQITARHRRNFGDDPLISSVLRLLQILSFSGSTEGIVSTILGGGCHPLHPRWDDAAVDFSRYLCRQSA